MDAKLAESQSLQDGDLFAQLQSIPEQNTTPMPRKTPLKIENPKAETTVNNLNKAIVEDSVANDDDEDGDDFAFRPGRPRSDSARKKILDATRKLLTTTPMRDLSIEAVAKKAKVGKTTIYRWWANKGALVMEAFLEQPGVKNVLPSAATPEDAIRNQLEAMIRQLRGQNGRVLAGIIAESQADTSVLELLYNSFLKERVEPLYDRIEEGKADGTFKADLDTDIAIDVLLGPLFLRVLSGEHGIDNSFAERYPTQALVALRA